MSDPSYAVQKALLDLLRATASDVGGHVYDNPPAGVETPYATIGEGEAAPTDEDGLGASELSLQVDVWSNYPGFAEVKRIATAYVAVLDDRPLATIGYVVERMHVRRVAYLRDPNGVTRRARIDLTIFTQPS